MAFNLFGKKDGGETAGIFSDKTYIHSMAKWNACLALAKAAPDTLFICWFPATARELKAFFTQHGMDETMVTEARFVHDSLLQNKNPVFAEHHPLHTRELELVKHWPQQNINVYSAMDEPLFKYFGSEKMIPLIKLLGMKEAEAIEHPFVSKSILKSQEKIAGQVKFESPANSQAEWLERNLQ